MLQQLIDYIKKERDKDFSDEDIKKALLSVGYPEETINESFDYIEKHANSEIVHEEKQIIVNEISDHKIDKTKLLFVAGCFVISIAIILFLIFATPAKNFSIPTIKNSLQEESLETKAALSKIDLNEGKTYYQVKEEVENAIEEDKIEKGKSYKETYENYRDYKEKEIVKDIKKKIKKGELEKNNNFSKTVDDYIEIKKKETILLQAAEKAIDAGIIQNKSTEEEKIEAFENLKKEIIENNTKDIPKNETQLIEEQPKSPEYGNCVAEIEFKKNTCIAAIKRDENQCNLEESTFFKEECKVFFYRSEMVLFKNNAVCESVPEELKLQCLAIADRDKSHCESLPENAKFGCMLSVDVAEKISSKDLASCNNNIIDQKEVCLAVLNGNIESCNKFDKKQCDIYI